jgi:hypothetical protein
MPVRFGLRKLSEMSPGNPVIRMDNVQHGIGALNALIDAHGLIVELERSAG